MGCVYIGKCNVFKVDSMIGIVLNRLSRDRQSFNAPIQRNTSRTFPVLARLL